MAVAPLPPFVLHCLELLEPVGPVRAKRMFGGYGLYAQDLFVALIADEGLYLRADDASEPHFRQAGGQPFEFEARGQRMTLRYWTPPAEALESPALMLPWARLATQAALSSRSPPAAGAARRRRLPPRARA
jgi:DNA transformation protein and related proteins